MPDVPQIATQRGRFLWSSCPCQTYSRWQHSVAGCYGVADHARRTADFSTAWQGPMGQLAKSDAERIVALHGRLPWST